MSFAGAYKLTAQTRIQDRLCTININYRTVAGDDALLSTTALTDAWIADCSVAYLDILAGDVTFEGVYATPLVPGAALSNEASSNSLPGTRSGNALPANSCAVFTLQTTNPAAIRQGRIYVSGISKDDIAGGLFSGAFVNTEMATFAAALASQITADGITFQPIIAQRVIAGVPGQTTMLDVSSVRVTGIPYTQRRRTTRQFGFAPAA